MRYILSILFSFTFLFSDPVNVTFYHSGSNSSSFQINFIDLNTSDLVYHIPLYNGTYGYEENAIESGTYYITASYPFDDPNNFDESQLVPDGTQITITEDIIAGVQGSWPELISSWTLLGYNASSSYINYCSIFKL